MTQVTGMGSKSDIIADIAGSTTNGIKNKKANTESIAVVPANLKKIRNEAV